MKMLYKLPLGLLILVALVGCMWSGAASAQTVIVKLLNGKSGKPISRIRVYIVLGDPKDQKLFDPKTDQQGKVQFEAKDLKTFQLRAIGTVTCGEQPIGAPGRDYPTDEVLKTGIVTANDCGSRKFEPIHGQLTYIARPATWLELFKN